MPTLLQIVYKLSQGVTSPGRACNDDDIASNDGDDVASNDDDSASDDDDYVASNDDDSASNDDDRRKKRGFPGHSDELPQWPDGCRPGPRLMSASNSVAVFNFSCPQ